MATEKDLDNYTKERGWYDKENRQHASKNRLRAAIESKVKTLFIGILAEFEKSLGENWGHGRVNDDCTDFELDNKAIWKLCRSKILDSGNDTIRILIKELDNYTVDLQKHTMVFKTKENKD